MSQYLWCFNQNLFCSGSGACEARAAAQLGGFGPQTSGSARVGPVCRSPLGSGHQSSRGCVWGRGSQELSPDLMSFFCGEGCGGIAGAAGAQTPTCCPGVQSQLFGLPSCTTLWYVYPEPNLLSVGLMFLPLSTVQLPTGVALVAVPTRSSFGMCLLTCGLENQMKGGTVMNPLSIAPRRWCPRRPQHCPAAVPDVPCHRGHPQGSGALPAGAVPGGLVLGAGRSAGHPRSHPGWLLLPALFGQAAPRRRASQVLGAAGRPAPG